MSLALSSLLKTWKPTLISFQFALEQQYSNILQVWLVDWSTKFAALQLSWEHLISGWQPPAIFETTQIIVWPIFLAAVLLFVVGNGLILSKIARNDRY